MPNVLISADAFTADILHEDRYFFGVAAPYSPVLMAAGGQIGPLGCNHTWGPFQHSNGNLYVMMENSAVFTGIYKSTDSGATWTQLDAANHPASGVATPYWDGADKILVAWRVNGAGRQQLRLQNFDIASETWGAAYGTVGAPSDCTAVGAAWVRSDDSVVVLYDTAPPLTGVPPASNFKAAVYSQSSPGGAWTTTVDVGVNMAAELDWTVGTRVLVAEVQTVLDSSDILHCFFVNLGSGIGSYQQLKLDNTLGQYTRFVSAELGFGNVAGTPFGKPLVVGSNLVLTACVNFAWPGGSSRVGATIYVGTPVSAPVFSLMPVPGISPDDLDWLNFGENFNVPNDAISAYFDGTTIYALWPREDSDGTGNNYAQLRLAQTTNLANPMLGWSDATIFDLALDSPPGFNFNGQEVKITSIAAFAAPVPAAPAPLLGSGGGGNVPVLGCQCCPTIRAPFKRRARKDELDAIPPGASHVEIRGTAVGPANTTPVLLCQYQVPNNRRFQLDGLVAIAQQIAGWTPGDGNVIFSLTINRTIGGTQAQGTPFNSYGTVTIPLGSLQVPWSIPRVDRLALFSREILRLTVQTDPAFILPGAGTRFLGLLKGYEW